MLKPAAQDALLGRAPTAAAVTGGSRPTSELPLLRSVWRGRGSTVTLDPRNRRAAARACRGLADARR